MISKKTKTKTNRAINSNSQLENLATSYTHEVFHCINNRGEHTFHSSKAQLLSYLGRINFNSVSILIEEVPTKFTF